MLDVRERILQPLLLIHVHCLQLFFHDELGVFKSATCRSPGCKPSAEFTIAKMVVGFLAALPPINRVMPAHIASPEMRHLSIRHGNIRVLWGRNIVRHSIKGEYHGAIWWSIPFDSLADQ